MREILVAIEAEPELPGHLPEEMFEVIRDDQAALAETLRIAVRQTKAGILKRVAKLYSPNAADHRPRATGAGYET
jgi:hypothetical protein